MHHDHKHVFAGSQALRDILSGLDVDPSECSHLSLIQDVAPEDIDNCPDCLLSGDSWVNLRMCLICGQVGCCDNSKNKHATKHYKSTDHALIVSLEPTEGWVYCYPDEVVSLPRNTK